jgi:hypothetical protein
MAYLYNYAGKPWKTQKMVRRVMDEFYSDEPDGLINNEDLGQMSAWYIFSAIGFYPVSPCGGYYDIGSPKVKKAVINLENGKSFTVKAKNNSIRNIYIQSAILNGKPFNRNFITHEEIMQGGILELSMGNKPQLQRGITDKDMPISAVELPNPNKLANALPTPFTTNANAVFDGTQYVTLQCAFPEAKIHYTLDGSRPDKHSPVYQSPFLLTSNTMVSSIAMAEGFDPSELMKQEFFKGISMLNKQKNIRIQSVSPPDVRGDQTGQNHFDGVLSTPYHTDKQWGVWRESDAEFIVNFGEEKIIDKLIVTYLDHTGMNIFPPAAIGLSSVNGTGEYRTIAILTDINVKETLNPAIRRVTINFKPIKTKEIKIVVESFGEMPSWYKGSGQPANMHLGEIIID